MARFVLSPDDDRFPRENENGGDDTVIGLGGDDLIFGGQGDDGLRGNKGRDDLRGGAGDDKLKGGLGDDRLRGNGGNDELSGNGGDDVLSGNGGRNSLTGGKGADRFIIESKPLPLDGRSETIRDFDEDEGDTIDVGFGLTSFRQFRQRADDSEDLDGNGINDTLVRFNRGESLVILDTSIEELKGDVFFG